MDKFDEFLETFLASMKESLWPAEPPKQSDYTLVADRD